MKKLFAVFAFAFMALTLMGQANVVNSVAVDTVKGAETIYLTVTPNFSSTNLLTVQAVCTQVGGTTDGTIVPQWSLDGVSFDNMDYIAQGYLYPTDTVTMTNGAVFLWTIKDTPAVKYRLKINGTSGDTTKVAVKYIYKP